MADVSQPDDVAPVLSGGARRLRVVGPGRAGGSLARALGAAGWEVAEPVGRGQDPEDAATGVDLLVVATPDASVARVAEVIRPVAATVVIHLAGSLGLEVLASHSRRGALHPLVSLPSAEVGAERLRGAWFAVAGDPLVSQVVADLGGRSFAVADEDRTLYHAAACIAANHLVALAGSVQRLADQIDVPFDAYLDLVRGTVENLASLGPRSALTGPAARGDIETVSAHRRALADRAPDELAAYDALVALARRLAAGPG